MSTVLKRWAQRYVSKLDATELAKITKKTDALGDMYDNRSDKFGKDQTPPIPKDEYVHRSILIRKGYVHFSNLLHRQMVSYYHPWMKGYLEKVEKALWSVPPKFIKPGQQDKTEPEEDETIKEFWSDNRLQAALKKAWHKRIFLIWLSGIHFMKKWRNFLYMGKDGVYPIIMVTALLNTVETLMDFQRWSVFCRKKI